MSRGLGSITAAVGVTTAFTLLSKILGFIREAVVALLYGTSGSADAFFVGSAMPMNLYAVLGSAVGPIVMPFIARRQAAGENDEHTFEGLRVLMYLLMGATAVLAIGGMIFAPALVSITSPGLNSTTRALAISVTASTFPSVIFWGLVGFTACVLQAYHRFTVTALAPAVQNFVFIVAVLALVGSLGVQGASWAIMASAVAHFAVQVPSLRKTGWRFFGLLHLERAEIVSCMRTVTPVMIAMLFLILNGMAPRFLGSFLASGSIAALSYGLRLFSLPVGLLGPPIGTAVYPFFSEWAAQDRAEELRRALTRAIELLIFVMVPITAFTMATSSVLVVVAFERGAFDQGAAGLTAVALLFFSLGMFPSAIQDLLLRGLWAYRDTSSPLLATAMGLAANLGFGLLMMKTMGMQGVALATALGAWVCTSILYCRLARHISGLPHLRFAVSLLRNTLLSTAAVLPIVFGVGIRVGSTTGIVGVFLATVQTLALYLLLHLLVSSPEAKLVRTALSKVGSISRSFIKDKVR